MTTSHTARQDEQRNATREALARLVASKGGVARVAAARDAGYSEHVIADTVARHQLKRICRGWLAVPGADPQLVRSARTGVVLTCVTEAKRRGLWVLDSSQTHVGARPHAGHVRVNEKAVVHWRRPPVPRAPDALVDPIENVLVLLACCQPYEATLAAWESALLNGLVEKAALARLDLPPAARRVLQDASPFSGSGLETFVVPRLRWLDVSIVAQAWIHGHRVDFLIGERLVLQIDGGHHVGVQREEDVAHDAQLMLLGFHVIRVTYGQVVDRWHEVQDVIMRAVAQGLHRVA